MRTTRWWFLTPVGCVAQAHCVPRPLVKSRLADKLIIRGNASEIIALAGDQAQSKGVDALDSSDAAFTVLHSA
ncbi:hydroxyethylthiazole kinase [Vibrio chagasii]|nr:hydroxyethylthiazole kinase [Vibrio chagasii]